MTKEFLIQQLNAIENAKRINRLRVADIVLKNKCLFQFLLETVLKDDSKIAIKAAWVLEFVCAEKLNWLAPHFTYFTKNINKIKSDSAIRPISKICRFIAKASISSNDTIIKTELKNKHIKKMIEVSFDWLIGNHKVAVKVYTMEMLFLFGKNTDWVHQELQLIIQQNILNESSAYKARGKEILRRINKK